MYDVITVGSATIDAFAHTQFSELISIRDAKHKESFVAYPVGTKILINELRFDTGGGGTNTAVACARLGLKTAWLGKLGNDDNANQIIAQLKRERVEVLASKSKKSLTGYSVILDSIARDRTILAYKGANDEWSWQDIPLKKCSTKWFYFCSMMGKSFDPLAELARYAEKKKINIAFNASSYLAEKGIDYIGQILRRTKLFVLNEEEATLLVGQGSPEQLCIRLMKHGPQMVVITEGDKGATATDGKHLFKIFTHKKKIVETTGAGDAFASTTMAGLIKTNNLEFALKLALTNAESVVMFPGAKNKLLTWPEIMREMKKKPARIKKKNV